MLKELENPGADYIYAHSKRWSLFESHLAICLLFIHSLRAMYNHGEPCVLLAFVSALTAVLIKQAGLC